LTGSLVSAVLLIAGTTVGAGILAIPSVTQESGFLASSVACIGCWLYMVRHHFISCTVPAPKFILQALSFCLDVHFKVEEILIWEKSKNTMLKLNW